MSPSPQGKQKGSIIVMALLLVILIATIGLATIAGVSGRYAASRGNLAAIRSASMAKMGIEDMMVKLAKDQYFPEGVTDDYQEFSFQDTVVGPDGKEVGLYSCTVDWSEIENGYYILTSVGTLGSINEPRARYRIRCKLLVRDFVIADWREGSI